MVFLTLVLPRRVNRITNVVPAAVYAVICVGNSVGEWNYYISGETRSHPQDEEAR